MPTQQVSYALTDIRIRFKIIVWVTHVYHRVISIGGGRGKKVNLDNLNVCSQKKKYCVRRINSNHAAFYFGEFVSCSSHDVSSSESTIEWNVTVINEVWNIMGAQLSGYCLINRINRSTAWRV